MILLIPQYFLGFDSVIWGYQQFHVTCYDPICWAAFGAWLVLGIIGK